MTRGSPLTGHVRIRLVLCAVAYCHGATTGISTGVAYMLGGRGAIMATVTGKAKDSSWRETAKIIAQALILAMVIRAFFYQPFNIPSGSMKETLLVGAN